MPPLENFPASQQVTFKYYEGVLSFLEENYVTVTGPANCVAPRWPAPSADIPSGREATDRGMDALPQESHEE